MIFLLLLIYAAYTDYAKRQIPNSVIAGICFTALFCKTPAFDRVMGLFFLTLPSFFVALKYDRLKGGDVKFLAAVCAYLGIYNLALTLIPATVTAVVYGYVRKEKSVPLAFVFCIGYIIFQAVIFLKGG